MDKDVEESIVWQHVKSGGLYVIVGTAIIEATMTRAVCYRSIIDGNVWVRPHEEFFDGRFRNLSADELRGDI